MLPDMNPEKFNYEDVKYFISADFYSVSYFMQ
jgi:hypothetical protein